MTKPGPRPDILVWTNIKRIVYGSTLIETNKSERQHKPQKTKFASKPNKVQSGSLVPKTGSPN